MSIPIEHLAEGMFVTGIDLAWEGHSFVLTPRGLVDREEISRLAKAGVSRVLIDTSRGAAPPAPGLPRMATATPRAPLPRPRGESPAQLERELQQAATIYSEGLSFSRELFTSAKAGRLGDVEQARALVSRMIPSVLRNPFALSILTRLRGHDVYTYRHSVNLAALSVVFGHYLGLERRQLEIIGMAGLYHDIGKARVPERILNKPGKLTPGEFQCMREHCREGFELISQAPGIPKEVAECARDHHERVNGTGYPAGKRGHELSIYSRTVGLIDVYDALTSERCYRRGFPPHQAMRTLYQARDEDFHADDVERFIKCMGIYPVTSLVRLSDGRVGVVCEANREQPLRPKVKLPLGADLSPAEHVVVDLAEQASPSRRELTIVDCLDPRDFPVNPELFLN